MTLLLSLIFPLTAHAQLRAHSSKQKQRPTEKEAGSSTSNAMPGAKTDDYKYIEMIHGKHEAELHDNGSVALETRLAMIERAQKSIAIETYIFKADTGGCLILSALVKKAREMRGQGKKFEVRLLLDKMLFGPEIDEFFVHEMAKEGIDLRYYNYVPAAKVAKVNHRNHKKTFMIDADTPSGELILGGRNIGDEYFDLHASDNFIDSDVHLKGPAVKKVHEIFDQYWAAPQVIPAGERPDRPSLTPTQPGGGRQAAAAASHRRQRLKAWEKSVADVKACLAQSPEKTALRKTVAKKAAEAAQRSSKATVNSVLVASDHPDWERTEETIGKELYKNISSAKKSVKIENPYFIPLDPENEIFNQKINSADKVKVDVIVNSRAATPEFGTTSIALYRAKGIASMGGGTYLFNGKGASDRVPGVDYDDDVRWATHSKTMVIDDKTAYVGSANFDPRSIDRLNSEIGLIFPDNPGFARQLTDSMDRRLDESVKIDAEGRDPSGKKVETPRFVDIPKFIKVGAMKFFEDQL